MTLTFTLRALQIPQPFLDFLWARFAGMADLFVFVESRVCSVQRPGREIRTVKANAWSDYETRK